MKHMRGEHYILIGLIGFLLAVAATTDYHRVVDYLFSDEAVYYMMAQSLAFDGDLEYTRQDLQRVYAEGWYAGPQGVYLTKIDDGTIYYGKYFIYSLFLAPFLAVFGFQGFLIFNMILLGLMIWMGWRYLRQFNPSGLALLIAVTFYLLSASFVYTFWLTPETFTMFWITTGLFLWLYRREERLQAKHSYTRMLTQEHTRRTAWDRGPIAAAYSPPEISLWQRMTAAFARGYLRGSTFLKWLFVSPDGRLYLAPIPLAIAYAAKITNVFFLLPILIDALLVGYRTYRSHSQKSRLKRVFPVAASLVTIGLIFIIVAQLFVGIQLLLTGQTNQYAGDRRMFIGNFPFNSPWEVWQQGIRHSNDDYWTTSFFLTPKTLLYNIYYYLFGRFTGMFPYFICSFLALYFFLRVVLVKHASPIETQEKWRRLALLFAIVAHIGAYILIAPINYHGGSGAFGNRFFLNIYPAFLFLITTVSPQRDTRSFPLSLLITWLIGSLF